MIDDNKVVEVVNRDRGGCGYQLPEFNIQRRFAGRETKKIKYGELFALSQSNGGMEIIKDFLFIKDEEARNELGINPEPEYFYTEKDVNNLLSYNVSLPEFLDALDFAPLSVIDMIKDQAVALPLNDTNKMKAILDKTGFDVAEAIKNKNLPYDDGSVSTEQDDSNVKKRRVQPQPKETGRRVIKKD